MTGSRDKKAVLFNAISGNFVTEYVGHYECITAVAFLPDGKRVVSTSVDGTIKVYSTFSGKLIYNLEGHKGPIFAMSMNLINIKDTIYKDEDKIVDDQSMEIGHE